MVNTIDFLAEAAISGGTNVRYGGLSESHTAAANIDATGILAVTRVRSSEALRPCLGTEVTMGRSFTPTLHST
jgi:hypothetical protein